MRLKLRLESKEGAVTLPFHYNHLLQSMIYQKLDEALAEWLHEKGYQYEKRRFKLFTFSRILSKVLRLDHKNKTITFKSPLNLKISALETEILESLAIHLVKEPQVTLNGTSCQFVAVEVEMPVQSEGPTLVSAISPITVYSTLFTGEGRKKTYFYNPWEKEFNLLILENLKKKTLAFYGEKGELPAIGNAYIKPVYVNKKDEIITKFKGFLIKGWMGTYEISLPEPYFTLAYNAGLGSKNSQGFGMIDVVKRHSITQNARKYK